MLFLYCLFLLCHNVVNVKYAAEKEHCEYGIILPFFFPSLHLGFHFIVFDMKKALGQTGKKVKAITPRHNN